MRVPLRTFALLGLALAGCGGGDVSTPWTEQRAALNEQGWTELPTSGYQAIDQLGWSVAIDDSWALVGTPGRDGETDEESDSGGARLFELDVNGPKLGLELVADRRLEDTGLGDTVALRADHAAIGSFSAVVPPIGDESPESATDAGLVYAFQRQGQQWLPQRLPDPRFGSGRQFGMALAATTSEILVGAPALSQPGEVFAFRFSNEWQIVETLSPPQSAVDDAFGFSLAGGETTIVVGAPGSGRAHVFERLDDEHDWSWVAELQANPLMPVAGDYFGYAVALHGDRAVVAAVGDEAVKPAAYVFERQGGTWSASPTHQFLPTTEELASGGFAETVAVGQNRLWIGAPYLGTGAIAAFEWKDANWQPTEALVPTLQTQVLFGKSLAARGRSLLAGAPFAEKARGSVFFIAQADGAACEMATDCQSGYCVDRVCCDSPCSGCYSCRAADKGVGDDGECGPVLAGRRTSSTTCEESPAASCGQTGVCDGAGRCAFHPSGTPCEAASCADSSTLRAARACDGRGACAAAQTKTCGHLSCIGASCEPCTRDLNCGDDEICGNDGCEAKRELLSPCTQGRECLSGFCPAEHCTDRAECTDDGSAVVELDGSKTQCENYGCRNGSCLSTCDGPDDCRGGLICTDEHECVTPPTPLVPSSETGSACLTSADCDFGLACGNEGRCEPIPTASSGSPSGGCATSGAPVTNDWRAMIFACLLTYLRAQRARATSRNRVS
jgi:FG-GAP repeat